MGILIDQTNFDQYLVQSTESRTGSPDGNVYFDVDNNIIELIGVDELPTLDLTSRGGGANDPNPLTNFDGITLRGLYNFENEQRRLDETLRKYERGSQGIYRFAGAFNFVNGVKLDDTVLGDGSTDRDKIRGSGWIEYANTGDGQTDIDRIYHGVLSLVDIQATTVPYWTLVTATDEATLQAATWADFVRLGDINEAVQVYGDTSYGDSTAGDFDYTTRILVVRVRSWHYNPGETTSVLTGISEFSGFSAGYGVGETINPANTYAVADVFGGAQIAPWDGMTLEELVTPQTETGFNEADGDFTWVLHNTGGGTVQECAAYLDALTLQASDIDEGTGVYDGNKGRVWYSRNAAGKVVTASIGGKGLFIEGLSTAEKQNVIMTDDAGDQKTYPYFPDVQITVGAAALADANAFYHVFYNEGTGLFDTANAFTVTDDGSNPVKGNVQTDQVGGKISFAYAYDTNTENGLSSGTDKDCVVIVEGDGGAAQAITYFTITRSAIVPVTCAPPVDNNA
jgi:hypothetical protein